MQKQVPRAAVRGTELGLHAEKGASQQNVMKVILTVFLDHSRETM